MLNHPSLQEVRDAFGGITLEEVGEGGFKRVYRAEFETGVEALKVIPIPDVPPPNIDLDAYQTEFTSRIAREIKALDLCDSPYIVLLGSLRSENRECGGKECLVYTEEFLEGDDLMSLIQKGQQAKDESEARLLTKCLVDAIEELWNHRFVHRDIKPQNIMRTRESERPFVLLDLGVAFAVQESGITQIQGAVPGTPRYYPPEFFDVGFRDRLTFRSDLYCAGVAIHEFCSGLHPVARDSKDMFISTARLAKPNPRPLKDRRSEFSDEFCKLIDEFLKGKPALRPGSFERIREVLEP